jgi:hypothetical protein
MSVMKLGPSRTTPASRRAKSSRDWPPIELKGRSQDSLRIGCLSWSSARDDETGSQSREELYRSLELASPHVGDDCDLVLCAGRRVVTPEPDEPEDMDRHIDKRRVREALRGAALCFEDTEWESQWLVPGAHGRVAWLREFQRFANREADTHPQHYELAWRIGRGEGRVHFSGPDCTLVVLMCGENNLLSWGDGPSCFKGGGASTTAALRGRWIVLNPAHTPYGLNAKKKVLGRDDYDPTLGRAVDPTRSLADGSKPPLAVVHCNNFLVGDGKAATTSRSLRNVVYHRDHAADRPLSPALEAGGDGIVAWAYAEYVIPMPA